VDRAQVDVPAPFADVVSVTDIVSELRTLAADITDMRHGLLQVGSELVVQNLILSEFPAFRQFGREAVVRILSSPGNFIDVVCESRS
jgi:hypothetical protein